MDKKFSPRNAAALGRTRVASTPGALTLVTLRASGRRNMHGRAATGARRPEDWVMVPPLMQRLSHFLTLTLSFSLLGACGGEKNTSDTDESGTGDTSGASTTGVSDTATATGATEQTSGMSSAPTTTEPTSPTTTATGPDSATDTASGSATDSTAGGMTDATGASETTGTVETTGFDPAMVCQDLCDKLTGCSLPAPPECVADCSGELDGLEDICEIATQEFYKCVNTMTCDEFVAFFQDEDPGPCAAEVSAQGDACSDEACSAGVGTNQEGTECSYQVTCMDEPVKQMSCAGDTCSCLVGDKEVGTCAAEGVCMALEQVEDKAKTCCQF